ncbi:MAG: MFS transporter, partial [Bacteroidetes bacterium]|nr:MFS transporter [Bacteroidota bacterium]
AIVWADSLDSKKLKELGIIINSQSKDLYILQIPVSSIFKLDNLSGVNVIDFAKKVKKRLDKARVAVNADKVQQGISPLNKAYLGQNTIIGVVDNGFDFTHPVFADKNGNTRINSCWVQSNTGSSPAGFNYGEELSTAQDLEQSVSSLLDESHGTHVLGIAAGNGNGSNNVYIGMAPQAIPVLVDWRGSDADLLDGIKYIFNKADQLKLPAVVNLSLGSHIGPHDGTSLTDKGLDNLTGKGRIIVGANWNDGDINLHIQHEFIKDTLKTFVLFEDFYDQTGSGIVDIWGDKDKSFKAALAWFDGNTGKEIMRTRFYNSDDDAAGDTLIIFNGDSLQLKWSETKKYLGNGKANIQLDINNLSSYYTAIIVAKQDGIIHMWNDGQGYGVEFTDKINNKKIAGITNGDNQYTCGEIGGTSNKIISVGAYATKVKYKNLKGNNIDMSAYATVGDIAGYSSKGPTTDLRTKPEITAPGLVIVSAVNSDDYNFDNTADESVLKYSTGGTDYYYAAFEGTSMAAPCVSGVIALILESNPMLDAVAVKYILTHTPILDNYTGTIGASGSNTWGYGKLNAFDAVNYAYKYNGISTENTMFGQVTVFPNPANEKLNIEFQNPNENWQITLLDVNGRAIKTNITAKTKTLFTIDDSNLVKGVYLLQLIINNSLINRANSVYNLVISSAIFPIYYTAVTTKKDEAGNIISDEVVFMGTTFKNTVLTNYTLALSFLLVCFISPLLSGIADSKGNKKAFLRFFCYLGATACAGLFFLTDNQSTLPYGVISIFFASLGFWSSLVFYNSFLPEITDAENMDKVSAKGFSLGYIGSSTLLIICLIFIQVLAPMWDISKQLAPRICFVLVAVWWVSFAQILFRNVPEKRKTSAKKSIWSGFHELKKVYVQVVKDKSIKIFLMSFFFYSMGVQTVMLVAAYFGSKLLGLPSGKLIPVILIIQFVGVAGSYLFSYISKKLGNKVSIFIALFIWILVCTGAYYIAEYKSEMGFYILAFLVGTVMGGIQSMSRSTYGKLIPEKAIDTASFFSFYDVTEKLSMVFGLFIFAYVEQHSKMQNSVLALIVFFVIGFLFLIPLKDARLFRHQE